MKKILNVIIVLIISLIMATYSNISVAATINSLKEQQNSNNATIKEKEKELKEIEAEKSENLKQVESLSDQIIDYEDEIDELENKISDLKNKISSTESKIKEDEKKYEEKQAQLKEMLVATYENGKTSYLDFFLASGNLIDFISSYYLISELTSYDTDLLEQVEADKNALEEEKLGLENDKSSLDSAKKTKEAKSAALKAAKVTKEKKVAELTESEKKTEEQIAEIKSTNKSLDKQIQAMQAEIEAAKRRAAETSKKSGGNSSGGASVSSSGFIRPVSSKFPITTKMYYSSGAYHGAVDFSGSGISGSPIYAVADGYVVTSTSLTRGGSYYSYGEYILIAHYNGLYTLYGHCSSRTVSAKQEVKQGDIIGYVGSTGNSTGPHLHFEVRTSPGLYANRVNPLNYLP